MANAQAPVQAKKQISKKQVRNAIIAIVLIELAILAYFFWRGQNPLNTVLNSPLAPATQPTELFGMYGSGKVGPLNRPLAVTEYNKKVFVSDTDNHRIVVFDYDGNPLYAFGSMGSGKGQFSFPYGIAVGNNGMVYVADLYNGNVQEFTQSGQFVKYFINTASKTVVKPAGLFIYNNQLFVTDVALDKVMAFDLNTGKEVLNFGNIGNGPGQLKSPNDVCVTANRIYVSDTGNDRVEIFDRSGKYVGVNIGGDPSAQTSAFVNTRGVGVDGRGTLFVVSNLTDMVFGFNSNGQRAFQPFGSLGQGNNNFSLPNGLFIDSQGRLYIADSMNQRIQVFQN